MTAEYTGQKIAELRKNKGMTQKALAERLSVTDKAVSKWERGLNYPDIVLFEPLAEVLDSTVLELLGLENESGDKVADAFSAISKEEKEKIRKELRIDGWGIVIRGTVLLAAAIWASKIFDNHQLYGLPQILTMGMIGVIGSVISSGVNLLRKLRFL
ncbi:MAG: helix-turn-helix transcriptional regulator [Oscillospiraceae bacterium]|nr:helix-turn-helix transcriptional regulator [Oscillospiraceae bacterium]